MFGLLICQICFWINLYKLVKLFFLPYLNSPPILGHIDNSRFHLVTGERKYKENQQSFSLSSDLIKEFNEIEDEEAIEKDKRKFIKIFTDIIKEKELFTSTIFNNHSKLFPVSLKMTIFFFTISSFFFLNGFFFTEDYITERYKMDKVTGFIYILL